MSAYMVGEAHIDYLLRAALAYKVIDRLDFAEASEIGRMLLEENRRSVDHRYHESTAPIVYAFTAAKFIGGDRKIEPLVVLKAVACLKYQSCEHDGWSDSEAAKFLERLHHRAIRNLPGYDDAAGWEIR